MKTYLFTRRTFDGNQQIDETRAVTAPDIHAAREAADCGHDWSLVSFATVATIRRTTELNPGTLAYRRLEDERDQAVREVAELKDQALTVLLAKLKREASPAAPGTGQDRLPAFLEWIEKNPEGYEIDRYDTYGEYYMPVDIPAVLEAFNRATA